VSSSDVERNSGGLKNSFVDFLAYLITASWIASFLLDMVKSDYDPPAIIHGLMMAVATAAFGSSIISRKGSPE
jgi:hypothetical protein